jgi:[ribosomal protein S5]-alanine N-acetyltransferase
MQALDLSRFFDNHPTLETERLLLREVAVADALDLHEYFSDPEIMRYTSNFPIGTIQETEGILRRSSKYLALYDSFRFAIVRKSDSKAIGTIDLHSFSTMHHRMEIGYMLTRAYWDYGYMTEAVKEIIRFAFEEMGMHRVEAECQTENIRSMRLAERCGMTLEATRLENEINKGRFVSNHVYAILRD